MRRRRECLEGQADRLRLAVEERAGRGRSDARGRHLGRRPPGRVAELDEPGARGADEVVVRVAVRALDDDLDGPSPVSGSRSIRSGSSRASIAAAPSVSAAAAPVVT